MTKPLNQKNKRNLLITVLVLVLASLVIFFSYNITIKQLEKSAERSGLQGTGNPDPGQIDISKITDDMEFAQSISGYNILFTGLLQNDYELSFLDIVKNYDDKIETFDATGIRSDGEVISLDFTGIKIREIFNNINNKINIENEARHAIIYGNDLYAANFTIDEFFGNELYLTWKKQGQYLDPSEDGTLKIVLNNGPTNKWVKNPIVIDFIADFKDEVELRDRLAKNSIDFITEQQMFTLYIDYVPQIDIESWELKVGGLSDNAFTLKYKDIASMPQTTVYATLETISNPAGGSMIGNAIWTGVPLKYILDEASVKDNAIKVIFYCEDGYSTAITIEEAARDDVILAYKMNGKPLAPEHGYPLRAVIPGKYGMKWAKWINEIEFTDQDYKGYWEDRGWSDYAGRDRPEERFD